MKTQIKQTDLLYRGLDQGSVSIAANLILALSRHSTGTRGGL
jgi:hypothetical protein